MRFRQLLPLVAIFPFVGSNVLAQAVETAAPARAISPEDYGKWESLGGGRLSPDGSWIAYQVSRVDGESELHLRLLE